MCVCVYIFKFGTILRRILDIHFYNDMKQSYSRNLKLSSTRIHNSFSKVFIYALPSNYIELNHFPLYRCCSRKPLVLYSCVITVLYGRERA